MKKRVTSVIHTLHIPLKSYRAELQFDCLTTELQSFRSTPTSKNLKKLKIWIPQKGKCSSVEMIILKSGQITSTTHISIGMVWMGK